MLCNGWSIVANAHLTEIVVSPMQPLLTAHNKYSPASLRVRQFRVSGECKAARLIDNSQVKLLEPHSICCMTECIAPKLVRRQYKPTLVSSES